jgi:ketosteroid isomerase-like protein
MKATELIERACAAFQARDRAVFAQLLAPDFTFTSPYDDHIDQAAYFERCWPNAERFRSFEIAV